MIHRQNRAVNTYETFEPRQHAQSINCGQGDLRAVPCHLPESGGHLGAGRFDDFKKDTECMTHTQDDEHNPSPST